MADNRHTYAYATYLILSVLFVTPVVGLALNRLGLPLMSSLLGILGLAFGAYGIAILWNGDVQRGLLVSVLVLMTIGANIPLGSLPENITIGPNLYIVDLPLFILAAITLSTWRREHLTTAHGLLVLYLVWSFLLVALAPGPRSDVMFWYAVHVARFILVFALATRGVIDDWLSARNMLSVIVLTTIGHALVATIQVITGPIDGLTVLGMDTRIIAQFPMGPLGSIPSGTYVGGFTGGVPFTVLLTIVIPIVVAAIFLDYIPRIVAAGGVIWLAFLLQLTAVDAARGALFVSLGLSFLLFGWWATGVLWNRVHRLSTVLSRSWIVARWRSTVGVAVSIAAFWQIVHIGDNPTHHPAYLDPELGQTFARSVNIPGFSTKNLAIRLYQYVGGVDTFLQYPLTGLGGANYSYIALDYGPKAHMIHNLYIAIFAETGLVGALFFFGAMGYSVRAIWSTAILDDDPLLIGLLAGIGGFLALQFFQPLYLRVSAFVPVWAILGIACGHYRHERDCPTNDAWAHAWTRSRGCTAIASSWTTQTVAALPGRIHAALHSNRLILPMLAIRTRTLTAIESSYLLSTINTAQESSVFVMVWRRLRRYWGNNRLFK